MFRTGIENHRSANMIAVLLYVLFGSWTAGIARADGAVYAMTNALGNNEIIVYHRDSNGNLNLVQTIATGGGGSGLQLAGVDALGSAGSLQLDENHHFLFAVNAESAAENNGAGAYNTDCQQGTITSFLIARDGTLTFADRVLSRGLFPNSLTVKESESKGREPKGKEFKEKGSEQNLLYVLNAGGPEAPGVCHLQPATANGPNITGFLVDQLGHMTPVDSTQPIDPGPASATGGVSCTAAGAAGFSALTGAPAADFQCGLNPPAFIRSPAQVGFRPDGRQLVVTVKGTNTIYVFAVDKDGKASNPTTMQAPGPELPTYFGFTFNRQQDLLVTETFGSATSIPKGGSGAVSTFGSNSVGDLLPLSSHIADGGTAAGWIALEPRTGRFAYVSNNLSASISAYTAGNNSTITLLNGTAASGAGPNDLATTQETGESFLYVLYAGTGTVAAYHINGDGSLTALTGGGGLPAGRSAQGLAAF